MSETLTGSILTPDGWISGSLRFGEEITAIDGVPVETPAAPYILPGFVDLHVHGGGGGDMMTGEDAIRTAARLHARHGTTRLLVTTVTAPLPETGEVLDAAKRIMAAPGAGEARIMGVHLEGPFINPGKLGAQPPYAIPGDAEIFRQLAARAPVRVITFAPECDKGGLLRAVLAAGVKAQIGHSLCGYAEAAAALACGCGVTHLFNAMTPVAHRGNGIAGAALAHASHAELIPDLLHVEPGAILAARRAIPGLYGVTDATAGAGMPDGEYMLGRNPVTKSGGGIRLADGTLAGSVLTMDQALRNLVSIGLPLAEASRRLSSIPADWIGEEKLGRLAPGNPADLLVFDDALVLQAVRVAGETVTP